MVKPGRMNRRITFQRQSITRDAVGQLVQTWTEICSRMVSLEPLNGREYFNASGENSQVTTRIRVRYDTTVGAIKPYDRAVSYQTSPGTVYDILSVINPNENNREIILMCKRAG